MTSNERYWSSLSLFVLWKREKQKQLFILFLFFPQLFEQDIFPSFLLFFQPHFSTVLALPLFTFSTILLFGFLKGKKIFELIEFLLLLRSTSATTATATSTAQTCCFNNRKRKGCLGRNLSRTCPFFFW